MSHDEERDEVTIDGTTFWRARRSNKLVELNSGTEIELGDEGVRWTVSQPGDATTGEPIESESRQVRYFLSNVVGAMERSARRAAPVHPIPKPTRSPESLPMEGNMVLCPLCRGECWPDCEVCDGDGVISKSALASDEDDPDTLPS